MSSRVERPGFARQGWKRLYSGFWSRLDLVFLAVIAIASVAVMIESFKLGVGTVTRPGPGLWPMLVSGVTAGLCLIAMLVGRGPVVAFQRAGVIRVALFALIITCFLPLYAFLGFIIASFVVVLLLQAVVYRVGWIKAVITAALSSIAIYLLFGVALEVPLTAFGS